MSKSHKKSFLSTTNKKIAFFNFFNSSQLELENLSRVKCKIDSSQKFYFWNLFFLV